MFDTVNECVQQLRYWMEKVILAAELQELTEQQFERLIVVARAGIVLINQLEDGEIVSQEWIIERDILTHAVSAILDIPEKKVREEEIPFS